MEKTLSWADLSFIRSVFNSFVNERGIVDDNAAILAVLEGVLYEGYPDATIVLSVSKKQEEEE